MEKLTLLGTDFYFDAAFSYIENWVTKDKTVLIVDDVVYQQNETLFEGYQFILVKSGEENKIQQTADVVIDKLLALNVDKSFCLVAVGGGTITDLTGYVASVYKRGIGLGLVPTSILGMVDAAIGGKNGINVGLYKNMVGTTYRPKFILFDYQFLTKLPRLQWVNGFAEIIKHACIQDEEMFTQLQQVNIDYFLNNNEALQTLVKRNVLLKMKIVEEDEFENADRFLLNFGHTFGHAIENLKELPHGFAISVGMHIASLISQQITQLPVEQTQSIVNLLQQYDLPTALAFDFNKALQILQKDKKREASQINFVLLNKIGEGTFKKIELSSLQTIEETVNQWK
jgi:3-dehydroquinate synthase